MAAFTFSSTLFAQHENHQKKQAEVNHKQDHLMMMGGKMLLIKNGQTMPLDKEMKLSNGAVITKDGAGKMKDGKTRQLKEGDMIYMNGKMARMQGAKTSMLVQPKSGC